MAKRLVRRNPYEVALCSAFLDLLIALITVIIPLAYASPVDPTWIAGIYDAADYDDVIDLLTDINSAGHHSPPLTTRPLTIVVASVEPWLAVLSNITDMFAFRLLRSPPPTTVTVVLRN